MALKFNLAFVCEFYLLKITRLFFKLLKYTIYKRIRFLSLEHGKILLMVPQTFFKLHLQYTVYIKILSLTAHLVSIILKVKPFKNTDIHNF